MDFLSLTRQARMAASCVTFRGYEPATTGRIAVAAPVFTQLRGYDEDCHGSGYEDVDFSQRCAAAADGGARRGTTQAPRRKERHPD